MTDDRSATHHQTIRREVRSARECAAILTRFNVKAGRGRAIALRSFVTTGRARLYVPGAELLIDRAGR